MLGIQFNLLLDVSPGATNRVRLRSERTLSVRTIITKFTVTNKVKIFPRDFVGRPPRQPFSARLDSHYSL